MSMEMLADLTKPVIHRPAHDLQSFYWSFLWVLFRHTDHVLGQHRCEQVFVYGDDSLALQGKETWLSKIKKDSPSHRLIIKDNRPLTVLHHKFRKVLIEQRDSPAFNHDNIIALFDEALETDGWPTEDDWVACTLLNKSNGTGSQWPVRYPVRPRPLQSLTGSLLAAARESTRSSSKRKNDEADHTSDQPSAGPSTAAQGSQGSSSKRLKASATRKRSTAASAGKRSGRGGKTSRSGNPRP